MIKLVVNVVFKILEQRVALILSYISLGVAKRLRGFLFLHRVMFEVLSGCVQATKRWVTLLVVQQWRGARTNPLGLRFLGGTENSNLHFVECRWGRVAKNAVYC